MNLKSNIPHPKSEVAFIRKERRDNKGEMAMPTMEMG